MLLLAFRFSLLAFYFHLPNLPFPSFSTVPLPFFPQFLALSYLLVDQVASSGSLNITEKISRECSDPDKKLTQPEFVTMLRQLLGELKVSTELQDKWMAQKNYVDRFGLSESETLLFLTNATHCFGVLTFPGTLFIYEGHVCFHRSLRPEVEKVCITMDSIESVEKAKSPPFFDTAIHVSFSFSHHSFLFILFFIIFFYSKNK